jgi:hypothetical protein
MRMLLHVKLPNDAFNAAMKAGTAGDTMQRILGEQKPEAAYFSDWDGFRSALLVINLNDPSEIPAFAEPWFLAFNGSCEFRVAMTPEDLGKANLGALAKKWA